MGPLRSSTKFNLTQVFKVGDCGRNCVSAGSFPHVVVDVCVWPAIAAAATGLGSAVTCSSTQIAEPQPWEPDLAHQPSMDDLVVVVAANPRGTDDLSWLKQQPYDYAIMTKGDPAGGIHNLKETWGLDASSYFQFILTHWDHLPERIAFLHGHRHSWHSWVSQLLLML